MFPYLESVCRLDFLAGCGLGIVATYSALVPVRKWRRKRTVIADCRAAWREAIGDGITDPSMPPALQQLLRDHLPRAALLCEVARQLAGTLRHHLHGVMRMPTRPASHGALASEITQGVVDMVLRAKLLSDHEKSLAFSLQSACAEAPPFGEATLHSNVLAFEASEAQDPLRCHIAAVRDPSGAVVIFVTPLIAAATIAAPRLSRG